MNTSNLRQIELGNYKIYLISAGNFKLDGGAMFGIVPKIIWEKLYSPADELNRIPLACNLMLIDTGTRRILIDTGNGSKMNEKFCRRYCINPDEADIDNLFRCCDIDINSITDVILTHLHFDHSGAATKLVSGKVVPTFSNAIYYVQKEHFDWAVDSNEKEKASFIADNYMPLLDSGQLKLLKENNEIFPGINVIPCCGHTHFMQLVKIENSGKSILHCADLIPTAAHLQSNFIMAYDNNPLISIKEKQNILAEVLNHKTMLFFEHDAFHKLAHIDFDAALNRYIIKEFIA